MSFSRRTFLIAAVPALAIAVIRRTHAEARLTTTEEVKMEITRVGSQPSAKGPADWFTGTVRIDPLFQPKAPARAAGNTVTFEPVEGLANDRIDHAYRTKYVGSPYLDSMLGSRARSATVKVSPRAPTA